MVLPSALVKPVRVAVRDQPLLVPRASCTSTRLRWARCTPLPSPRTVVPKSTVSPSWVMDSVPALTWVLTCCSAVPPPPPPPVVTVNGAVRTVAGSLPSSAWTAVTASEMTVNSTAKVPSAPLFT